MKKKLVLLAILVLASLLFTLSISGCALTSSKATIPAEYINNYIQPDASQPQFEMAGSLPDMPEKVSAYRIKYPTVNKEYAIQQAMKFGVEGETLEGDDLFTVIDTKNGNTVEVFKTGAIWYRLNSNAYTEAFLNEQAELPTLEESGKIAVDYLEEKRLLPLEVKQFMNATKAEKGSFIRVTFSYRIGDYQCTGPGYGYGYAVFIGDKGIIIGVDIYHPEIESYTDIKIITPEKALEALQNGKGRWSTSGESKAVLSDTSIRYYFSPWPERQEYVLPVYVLEGVGIKADGTVSKQVIAIAPAVLTSN